MGFFFFGVTDENWVLLLCRTVLDVVDIECHTPSYDVANLDYSLI